jgi:type IV pilus assembly protein PilO
MREALLETLRLNKRLLIAAAVLALVTLGLCVTVSTYQAPEIADAQLKWNDLRRRSASIGRGDVTSAYKQGQIDLAKLTDRIPLKRQFPRVLGDLIEAAASNGAVTGALTYKPEVVKGENLLDYGLTMKISGRYAAIKSFLADLLNTPELIVVEGFSLTNSDPFEEDVSMDLHLTVYLREGA